jgi:hypothetical protein
VCLRLLGNCVIRSSRSAGGHKCSNIDAITHVGNPHVVIGEHEDRKNVSNVKTVGEYLLEGSTEHQ